MENTQKERRTCRRRVLKPAQITFNGHSAVIDCTVRDISDGGARLMVESPVGIPDTFGLAVGGETARQCRVVWRKTSQIGVEFV